MKLHTLSTADGQPPGIIKGIIFAFLVSLMTGVTSLAIGGFIYQSTLICLVLYTVTFSYLIYLLKNSNARIGRVLVISVWAIISLMCWLFDVPLLAQLLIQTGSIWLVRSLYFHASLLTSLIDLGLVCIGLAASAWAMVNTGSLAAAVWSFFLTQALFCWLPDLSDKASTQAARAEHQALCEPNSFQSAHRVALAAVHKLTQR